MEAKESLLLNGEIEDEALLSALRSKAAQARLRRAGRNGAPSPGEEGGKAESKEGERAGDEGSPRREVRQPRDIFDVPLEDNYTKSLWIQLNTHDLLSFYGLIYHTVHKECTPVSCPKMSAGPNFEFLWSEGEYSNKPTAMPAREYTATLVQWAHKLTNGFDLDPNTDEATFKKTYRLIWSRSFRIVMHLYWHHWTSLTELKLDALLNAFTKHFVIFALKFRLLTSWDSVSAIHDLLSTILPPLYANQLNDLRDGKKKAARAPRRRAKEARAIPAGRRRAYTEWDERSPELERHARPISPPPAIVIAAEVAVVEETKGKDEWKGSRKEERKGESRNEDGGGNKKAGKGEGGGGSSRKGGGPSEEGGAVPTTEEAAPLKAGQTLEGLKSSVTHTGVLDEASGAGGGSGGSGIGSGGSVGSGRKETSPRLDTNEQRKKGSRLQMTKEEFIRELQRQKEQKERDGLGGASPRSPTSPKSPLAQGVLGNNASPRGVPRTTTESESDESEDDSSGEGSGPHSRTSLIELPEPVRRFFTPPGSPRAEPASPPSLATTPLSPKSPLSPASPASPASPNPRRLTTHAASAPAGLRYPTIPPSFDVAKAMADLTALDQEYADFEELHVLEEKLISASSRTNLPESPGRGAGSRSLADLFGQQQQQQGKEKEKAGSGDDEEEGIYSMLSPRKYAKRPSVINQKEFEELRLQLQDQEKKRSRTWVTKRTSLPRNMQELKGSYIREGMGPIPQPSKRDSNRL